MFEFQIKPAEPAVNPTIKKNVNSNKSLGKELTIKLNWVILPCAPQVYKFFKNITKKKFFWASNWYFFLFSKDFVFN